MLYYRTNLGHVLPAVLSRPCIFLSRNILRQKIHIEVSVDVTCLKYSVCFTLCLKCGLIFGCFYRPVVVVVHFLSELFFTNNCRNLFVFHFRT